MEDLVHRAPFATNGSGIDVVLEHFVRNSERREAQKVTACKSVGLPVALDSGQDFPASRFHSITWSDGIACGFMRGGS